MDESLSRSIGRRDDHGTGGTALSWQEIPNTFQDTRTLVIAKPFRAWQSTCTLVIASPAGRGNPVSSLLSLRGRSRRELTRQSSLRRYMGCRGCGECRMIRLDCRVATLLEMTKRGREWARWDGSAGLPHRGCAPSRNDNGGTGMGGVVASRFSGVSLYAVIASPAGRGNPVSSLLSLRGRSRRELTWQSSRDRTGAVEKVPRVAEWFRWIAASLCSSQ